VNESLISQTGVKIDILSKYTMEIANYIPESTLLLELGAGCIVTYIIDFIFPRLTIVLASVPCVHKTVLLLDAIEAQKLCTRFGQAGVDPHSWVNCVAVMPISTLLDCGEPMTTVVFG